MKTVLTTVKILLVFLVMTITLGIALTRPVVSADVNISVASMLDDINNTVVKQEILYKVKKDIITAVNKLPDKESFLKELNSIANDIGVDPSLILIKFYIESGIDPTQRNRDTDASGIFQLMWFNLPKGMTPKEFSMLSATEQLKYYRKYITPYKKYLKNAEIEDLYLLGLYPAKVINKTEIIFVYPSENYIQNRGLDTNKDGKITRRDIRRKITNYLENPV